LNVASGENRESVLARQIENAVQAGIHWVQIREKDLPARHVMDLTRAAIQVCHNHAPKSLTRILVNDRCDVAWAARAAGVHLGEKSLPVRAVAEARRAFGTAEFLIGVSCHSVKDAIRAAEDGADYAFFGPVFATPSKAGFGSPQGAGKLAEVCRAVSIPVIAIGGITPENARSCRAAGAAGIAAIRLFQQNGELAEIVARLTRE
jgi:thiamine-phosphate pyrophosphorylase